MTVYLRSMSHYPCALPAASLLPCMAPNGHHFDRSLLFAPLTSHASSTTQPKSLVGIIYATCAQPCAQQQNCCHRPCTQHPEGDFFDAWPVPAG